MTNTNCAAKVCEYTGLESPLTPTLSPLDKGGEGREWGILHAQEFVNFAHAIGISQAGAHVALDILELDAPLPEPPTNGATDAEAFEGCFVNPITRYGEAEALTTELVFIGQQMPEADIRRRLDNCCR
jgi:Cobalamin synthesis protein cobW C-terminal domain.